MKYIIMDQIINGDLFTEEYDDKNKAIKEADRLWDQLSDYDKNRRDFFHVLESVNPDIDAINHFDGNPIYILK